MSQLSGSDYIVMERKATTNAYEYCAFRQTLRTKK